VDVVRNPIYATGVGLMLFGYQNRDQRILDTGFGRGLQSVWERMKGWFQGNF
jgi:cell division protein FtsA